MELVSLPCNRDFTSASSYGLGWYKCAIATQWYQFHTTDAWWFSLNTYIYIYWYQQFGISMEESVVIPIFLVIFRCSRVRISKLTTSIQLTGTEHREFYPFKFVPMICLSSTPSPVWTRFRPYVVTSSICFLGITVTSHKCHGISNKQQLDFLFNSLFRLTTTNKISALLVLCEGNLAVTGGFPTQRTNNAETISMWWCLHWP